MSRIVSANRTSISVGAPNVVPDDIASPIASFAQIQDLTQTDPRLFAQTGFRIDTNAHWIEEDIEVKVRNQKPDEAVNMLVRENLYRWSNWTLLRKSQEFTKEDARTIHFPLRIAPKGEATVRYTVRYTW